MDPNKIDIPGIPTTLAIIGAVFLIVITLKHFNMKYPQVMETIKNATPWMGWVEKEDVAEIPPFVTRAFHPINR